MFELSVSALLADAENVTQLSDWGDMAFIEPLSIYLEDINENSTLTARGRELVYKTARRLLSNRLKIQCDLRAYPNSADSELPQPIFITGLPRTGTTLLHRLLSTDANARYLRLWEGMFPSPPPVSHRTADQVRRQLAADWVSGVGLVAPAMTAAHYFAVDEPEECYLLLEHSFVDTIFELRTDVPRYSEYVMKHEAAPALYAEYKRMLQLLSIHTAATHWVLKAPRHLMGLAGLIEVFPNARVIHVHRDVNEAVASLCSLCEIDRRIYSDNIDRAELGKFWLNRLANGVDSALAVRMRDRTDRYIDVYYTDLLADPIAVLKNIYARAELIWSEAYERNIADWLRQYPQHQHGRHRYQLDDYALTPDVVNARFENYRQRFFV